MPSLSASRPVITVTAAALSRKANGTAATEWASCRQSMRSTARMTARNSRGSSSVPASPNITL